MYSLLFIPPALLLIETIRGALHESQMVATQTRQTELQLLRSHALRLREGLDVLRDVASADTDTAWIEHPQVVQYWSNIKAPGSQYFYLAVVDRDGDILLHTDEKQVGRNLARGWYDRRAFEHGEDLTWSEASSLAGGREAYDVSMALGGPADDGSRLYAGLDATWLEAKVARERRSVMARWGGVLAIASLLFVGVAWAMAAIIRHQRRLQKTLVNDARRRARELAQIGSGLAHEIRNPLHALRINLHTLRRALGGKSSLPPDQVVATIDDSDGAINRLDHLMRDLLVFSDPTQGQVANLDLVHEVQATLRLLAEDLRRERIAVREAMPADPAPIAIDPAHLRQSLLNLFTFAQHRSGKAGTIEITVAKSGDGVELSVADSGPAMATDQQKHIFEPFQATAETGSGLGLALVQTYVEEVGGKVSCNGDGTTKNRCRVWFPLAESANGGTL